MHKAIFLFATTILLTGCVNSEPVNTAANNDANEKLPMTDQVLYQGGMEFSDPGFCQRIGDAALKSRCLTDVADEANQQLAVKELNAELCNSMSTDDRKSACKIQVELAGKRISDNVRFLEDYKLQTALIQAGDVSACRQLGDETMADGCELNILAAMGETEEEQKNACLQASKESIKLLCLQRFQQEQL